MRLIQEPGSARMGIEVSAVEGPPTPVVLGSREVRDEDVGVNQRVPSSTGAVAERRGHEPARTHLLSAARPPPRPGSVPLKVVKRCRDRRVVRRCHLPHRPQVTESIQHGD